MLPRFLTVARQRVQTSPRDLDRRAPAGAVVHRAEWQTRESGQVDAPARADTIGHRLAMERARGKVSVPRQSFRECALRAPASGDGTPRSTRRMSRLCLKDAKLWEWASTN